MSDTPKMDAIITAVQDLINSSKSLTGTRVDMTAAAVSQVHADIDRVRTAINLNAHDLYELERLQSGELQGTLKELLDFPTWVVGVTDAFRQPWRTSAEQTILTLIRENALELSGLKEHGKEDE